MKASYFLNLVWLAATVSLAACGGGDGGGTGSKDGTGAGGEPTATEGAEGTAEGTEGKPAEGAEGAPGPEGQEGEALPEGGEGKAPELGQSDFTSYAGDNGGRSAGGEMAEGAEGEESAPTAGNDATKDADGGDPEIEESDIALKKGDSMYLLNHFRGLQILDVANPAKPAMKSQVTVRGYPREMFVRDDGRVIVVTTAYFDYWFYYAADASPDEGGTIVTVIDARNENQPVVEQVLTFPGYIMKSRIIDGVLYAVTNRWGNYWYWGRGGMGGMEGDAVFAACGRGPGRGACVAASGVARPNFYEPPKTETHIVALPVNTEGELAISATVTLPGNAARAAIEPGRVMVVRQQYDYSQGGTREAALEQINVGEGKAELAGPGAKLPPDGYPVELTMASDGATLRLLYTEWGSSAEQATLHVYDTSNPTPEEIGSLTLEQKAIWNALFTDGDLFFMHRIEQCQPNPNYCESDEECEGKNGAGYFCTANHYCQYAECATDADCPSDASFTSVCVDRRCVYEATSDAGIAPGTEGAEGEESTEPGWSEPPEQCYYGREALGRVDLTNPGTPVFVADLPVAEKDSDGWTAAIKTIGDALIWVRSTYASNAESVQVRRVDITNKGLAEAGQVGYKGYYGWSARAPNDDSSAGAIDTANGNILILPVVGPYTGSNDRDSSVHLLEAAADGLVTHGEFPYQSYGSRIKHYGEHIYMSDDWDLAIANIADLDNPAIVSSTELARSVVDIAVAPDGNLVMKLEGNWYDYNGSSTFRVVSGDAQDEKTPLAEVKGLAGWGQVIWNMPFAYQITNTWDDRSGKESVHVAVLDFSDSTKPVMRSETTFAYERFQSYWNGNAALDGTRLYLIGNVWDKNWENSWTRLDVLDLSDPDKPAFAGGADLKEVRYPWGPFVRGGTLYVSTYDWVNQNDGWARYYVAMIDVSDPSAPKYSGRVNIPGYLHDISADGNTLYTIDYQWVVDGIEEECATAVSCDTSGNCTEEKTDNCYTYERGHNVTSFNVLERIEDKAYLRFRREHEGYLSGARVRDGFAYLVSVSYPEYKDGADPVENMPRTELLTLDARDINNVTVADSQKLLGDHYLREITGGYLFLQGWQHGQNLIKVYDLEDPAAPNGAGALWLRGWTSSVAVTADRIVVASGPYGLEFAKRP